jgi:SHS2 domain-containing protein
MESVTPAREGHWEHFPHAADMGVRGYGVSPAEAFEQAALALTAIVTDPAGVRPQRSVAFRCEAAELELLFYDFLNELVYRMAVEGLLFGRYAVRIEESRLEPGSESRLKPGSESRLKPGSESRLKPGSESRLKPGSESRLKPLLQGWRLVAEAWGEPVDVARHQPVVEIKGATFTELAVRRQDDGRWLAQCVLDI